MIVRRFGRCLPVLCAIATWVAAGPAWAAPVPLLEVGDTIASATPIPPGAFTLPSPPTAFGDLPTATITGTIGTPTDLDWISVVLSAGVAFTIDVDGTSTFDPILYFFDGTGTLLGLADDSALDPGSGSIVDSYLGVTSVPVTGVYFLAIGDFEGPLPDTSLGSCAPSGFVRPDALPDGSLLCPGTTPGLASFSGGLGSTGDYTIEFSIAAAPEPSAALLLALALGGLAATRRRG